MGGRRTLVWAVPPSLSLLLLACAALLTPWHERKTSLEVGANSAPWYYPARSQNTVGLMPGAEQYYNPDVDPKEAEAAIGSPSQMQDMYRYRFTPVDIDELLFA
eukprot:765898-Hanusia_phi.AAC.5